MPTEHVVTTDSRTPTFSAHHAPALSVDPGDVVTFETGDVAYQRLADGEAVDDIGLENFNLVTGPVAVRGASAGDVLRVDVLDVEIARAWSVWLPEFGGLGARTDEVRVRQIEETGGGRMRIADDLTVDKEPMIGCVGVAPEEGEASTFSPAHPTGGNMDLRELSPGATVWLPVEVDEALLSVGDLHAAMGRGEPTWVSFEAAGRARVRVDLAGDGDPVGDHLSVPRLRVGSTTLCLGMGETLDDAHQHALDQAYDLLTGWHGLTDFDAYAYASARVGMRLGGPASPMVLAEVPDPG
jgi:amidase